ncbi:hypothetical protein KIPB_006257, partial [Kipferlia bialata]
LVREDCTAALSALTPLVGKFKEHFQAMCDIDFDPSAALLALQDAYRILNVLTDYDITPLPPGTSSLTLGQKKKYVQVEDANDLYRALMRLAGDLVDCETEIKEYSRRLSAIESAGIPVSEAGEDTDLDRWDRVDILTETTVDLLTALATAQTKAHRLMAQLEDVEEVTQEDIDDATIDRDMAALKMSRPRLSDQDRATLSEEHSDLSTKVTRLVSQRETRIRLLGELKPYLFLPEVADALGEPLRERRVDPSRKQHPCDWGERSLVTGDGLIEGMKNLPPSQPALRRCRLFSYLIVINLDTQREKAEREDRERADKTEREERERVEKERAETEAAARAEAERTAAKLAEELSRFRWGPKVQACLRDGSTTLCLHRDFVGVDGAKALALALPSLTSLTCLRLEYSGIRDEGATALALALPSLTSLTHLSLHNNSIGDDGAKALAQALPSLTALTKLELITNKIGDYGAIALASALRSLTALPKLNLCCNRIGDYGAEALALTLPSLTALTELSLDINNIGDYGAKALARALPSLTSLTHLNLHRNNIGDEGAKAFAVALRSMTASTAFTALCLENNRIGDEGAKALRAVARKGCSVYYNNI